MEMFTTDKFMPRNTIRDFFTILFKYRKKVMVTSLTILITVGIGTFLLPKVYETEAKLFIRMGNETLRTDSANGQLVQISQSMENQLNSEIEILRSQELAEKVVKNIGVQAFHEKLGDGNTLIAGVRGKIKAITAFPKLALARFLSDPAAAADIEREKIAAAVARISDNLEAAVVVKSNVINLNYQADDPQLAHDVLTSLISIYLEKHIELHGSPGSFEFFRKESERLREALEKSEAELKEMKNAIGVGDLVEQRSILSKQLGFLQQAKQQAESDMASSRAKIQGIRNRLETLPPNVVVSETTGFAQSAAEAMRNKIDQLKLQEQELLSTFKPGSIPVAEVRRQIREAEALAGKTHQSRQVTRGINQIHQDLGLSMMVENGSLEAFSAKQEALEAQIAAADRRLKDMNEAEIRISRLQREKDLLEQNYRKYADNLEQMRIDQAREIEKISNISVAQAPEVPLDPIRPKTGLNLVLGLMLAVCGGLGLAFFLEYLDDTIQRPEHVEKYLELPVLGSIRKLEY